MLGFLVFAEIFRLSSRDYISHASGKSKEDRYSGERDGEHNEFYRNDYIFSEDRQINSMMVA